MIPLNSCFIISGNTGTSCKNRNTCLLTSKGMKLAEMHVDDWTIARLLGHRSLRNVKYYRKMSNKILADDTRKTRNRLSKMVLECLEGWEEEYEQIRFDDSLQ